MNILINCGYEPKDIKISAKYLITISNYLSNNNNVFLITSNGKKIKDVDFVHIPVGIFSYGGLKRFNTFFEHLQTLIYGIINAKNISPDILLCHGRGILYSLFIEGIVISKLLDIPLVLEWTGSDLLKPKNKIEKIIQNKVIENSTHHIVRSKPMKDKIKNISQDLEVSILPSIGVDMEKFSPRQNDESPKKKDTIFRILFVGRLKEVKGLRYLIKGFANLNKDKIKLIIIGDGELKKELIKLAEKYKVSDRVEFIGSVPHNKLPYYYRKSNIFILPSLSEGLPNVIMEAMACGLPVIATNVGGNTDLVVNRKGGMLISPKNSQEISKAIKLLYNNDDLKRRMGNFNRLYVNKFDKKKVLKEKLEIIENIAHKRN